ncbi:MAG: hypothetical protein MI717_07785 [Spirochaetales bacterium]|nr:hypothetical protein [Spirochaetales bacterium]
MAVDKRQRDERDLERYGVWVKTGPEDSIRPDAANLELLDVDDGEQESLLITEEEEQLLGELEESSLPDFDDLELDNDSFAPPSDPFSDPHQDPFAEVVPEPSLHSSLNAQDSEDQESKKLLQQIEGDLSALRDEIRQLKDELSGLRQAPELPQEEESPSGFFEEEEDETIALTGDELDNILDTADMQEMNAGLEVAESSAPSPTTEEPQEDSEESMIIEDLDLDLDDEIPSLSEDSESELQEEGLQEEPVLDIPLTDETDEVFDAVDLTIEDEAEESFDSADFALEDEDVFDEQPLPESNDMESLEEDFNLEDEILPIEEDSTPQTDSILPEEPLMNEDPIEETSESEDDPALAILGSLDEEDEGDPETIEINIAGADEIVDVDDFEDIEIPQAENQEILDEVVEEPIVNIDDLTDETFEEITDFEDFGMEDSSSTPLPVLDEQEEITPTQEPSAPEEDFPTLDDEEAFDEGEEVPIGESILPEEESYESVVDLEMEEISLDDFGLTEDEESAPQTSEEAGAIETPVEVEADEISILNEEEDSDSFVLEDLSLDDFDESENSVDSIESPSVETQVPPLEDEIEIEDLDVEDFDLEGLDNEELYSTEPSPLPTEAEEMDLESSLTEDVPLMEEEHQEEALKTENSEPESLDFDEELEIEDLLIEDLDDDDLSIDDLELDIPMDSPAAMASGNVDMSEPEDLAPLAENTDEIIKDQDAEILSDETDAPDAADVEFDEIDLSSPLEDIDDFDSLPLDSMDEPENSVEDLSQEEGFDELPGTEEVDLDSLAALTSDEMPLSSQEGDVLADESEDESFLPQAFDEDIIHPQGDSDDVLPEIEFNAEPSESPIKESAPSPNMEIENLSGELKDEIKDVLKYMDQLLESLPDEKIQEFARSEHFEVYKKIFEELGIAD